MALTKENEEKKFDKHILKSGACDLACTAVLGCSPVQDSSRALLLVRGGIFTWGSLAQCTSNGERVHYIDHDHFLKYLFEMIREDVAMLVDWGVDYLKYDNCFPRMVFKFHLESIILSLI